MGSFVTYYPTRKYPSHFSQSSCFSRVSYCYPLSILPLPTIKVFQSREFKPLRAPCRRCARPAELSIVLQKVFLTVERLVSGGVGKLREKERNEGNNWAVNYEVGIAEPAVFSAGGFRSRRLLEDTYFPFKGEQGVEELGGFIRGLYGGKALDGGKGKGKGKGKRVGETPRKLPRLFGPMTPPAWSRQSSRAAGSPPRSMDSETSSELSEEENIPDLADLKGLFSLLDKVERGSFTAAKLMEAFADLVIGQVCDNCRDRQAVTESLMSGSVAPEEQDSEIGTDGPDPTPKEHTSSTAPGEEELAAGVPPLSRGTPGDSPPSTIGNNPTPKVLEKVASNMRTPERCKRKDLEGTGVSMEKRWYASITPRAEKRLKLENPDEEVDAIVIEEGESDEEFS